jgi:Ca-activated chloride channel family protein
VTLLSPLGLVALLAIPILLVFYLLRVRYQDHEVGSTYLWEQLVRDLAVHEPWQKPRFSVLLLIQALLLGGLALALARPAVLTGAAQRAYAVVVLDGSASMNATDVGPTRFERARQLARSAVADLPDGSTATVVLAGAHPDVLAAETADRPRIYGALDRATPSDAAGDLAGALRMAVALARGRANGQVLVFSDGAFEPPNVDATGVKLSYTPVAGGDDNRAIVAIDARANPQNRRQYQAFVRVQNYANRPLDATVSLRADDRLVDSQTLHLDAGGSGAAVFPDLPNDARVLEARLPEGDALAADDRAWTVLERRQATQVLLVTRGNFFLERILSVLPDVELYRVLPRRLGAIDDSVYDALVFDGPIPDVPPRRPLMIVNHQDSPFLPVKGIVRQPATLTTSDDPLMRYVDLRDVRVSRRAQVDPPSWARVLADANGVPAILAGEPDGRRVVVFLFDLQGSNLPLSASFPILMSNLIGYLEPPRTLDVPVARPGAALTVQPQPGADRVVLEGDAGVVAERRADGGPLAFDAPTKVGSYLLRQLGGGRPLAVEPFAVDLTDQAESDLRPRTLDLPSGTPSGGGLPGSRELWTYGIVAALGLLTFEWFWFHKRA